jgi:hypothetical protein
MKTDDKKSWTWEGRITGTVWSLATISAYICLVNSRKRWNYVNCRVSNSLGWASRHSKMGTAKSVMVGIECNGPFEQISNAGLRVILSSSFTDSLE